MLTILDSTISHNTGVGVGVGFQGKLMLIRSTIIGNTGGGISVFDGGVTLRDSIVTANTTTGDGGGIFATHAEPIELDGASSVDHNSATSGGGIEVSESGPLILNGTSSVHDNTATGDSDVAEGGGGIWLAMADAVLNDFGLGPSQPGCPGGRCLPLDRWPSHAERRGLGARQRPRRHRPEALKSSRAAR